MDLYELRNELDEKNLFNESELEELDVLSKFFHRTRHSGRPIRIAQATSTNTYNLGYNLKNRAGRAHSGQISIKGRCRVKFNKWLQITSLPKLLLAGKVKQILYASPKAKLVAVVKTFTGSLIIIPAVRGLKTNDIVNRNSKLGSFVRPSRLPKYMMFCNVISSKRTRPTYVCAPGTYASGMSPQTIWLPRGRKIHINDVKLIQVGINAGHDWRHVVQGTAGAARKLGKRPIVNMRAKNPLCRRTSQPKFASTRKVLPWQ
jgi:ribosomal protein L2